MSLPYEMYKEILDYTGYNPSYERVSKSFQDIYKKFKKPIRTKRNVISYLDKAYPSWSKRIRLTYFHMNRAALLGRYDDIYMMREIIDSEVRDRYKYMSSTVTYSNYIDDVNDPDDAYWFGQEIAENKLLLYHLALLFIFNKEKYEDLRKREHSRLLEVSKYINHITYEYENLLPDNVMCIIVEDLPNILSHIKNKYSTKKHNIILEDHNINIVVSIPENNKTLISTHVMKTIGDPSDFYLSYVDQVNDDEPDIDLYAYRLLVRTLYDYILKEPIVTKSMINWTHKLIKLIKEYGSGYADFRKDYNIEYNLLLQYIFRNDFSFFSFFKSDKYLASKDSVYGFIDSYMNK